MAVALAVALALALALGLALALALEVAVCRSGAGAPVAGAVAVSAGRVYLDPCNAVPRDLGARSLALPAARTSAGTLARAQLQRV